MTKHRSTAALTALCIAALIFSAPASSRAEKEKPETELGGQMEKISKNLKALGKQVTDDSRRESSMKRITAVLEAARKARTLTPAKAEKIPEAERPQFVADFQKQLDKLIAQLEKVESAIRDGKTTEAKTLMGGLKEIKREGHEKFTVEEDE